MKPTALSDAQLCNKAERITRNVLAGEATKAEEDQLTKHLSSCRKCSRKFMNTLNLANKLKETLSGVNSTISLPEKLELPERHLVSGRQHFIPRVLLDFIILTVLGIGLLILMTLTILSYKTIHSKYRAIWKFQTIQEILILTNEGKRMVNDTPNLSNADIRKRLKILRGRETEASPEFELTDHWGKSYILTLKNSEFSVRSGGPNGKDEQGSGDDITISSKPPPIGKFSQHNTHTSP